MSFLKKFQIIWPNVGLEAAELLKKSHSIFCNKLGLSLQNKYIIWTGYSLSQHWGARRVLDQLKAWDLPDMQDSHQFFAVLDPQASVMSFTKKSAGNQSNHF